MGTEDNLARKFAERCREDFVEDGGRIIIECSNCKAKLVEIWRTRPHVQVKTNVIAKCGLCGDKSFTKTIGGGFHMAPVENGRVMLSNTEQGETTMDGDILVTSLTIHTEKK